MKVGNMVFVSGQIPYTPDGKKVEGTIGDKTVQCIKNIEGVLLSSNSSLDKVIKVNAFLTDMGNFGEFNKAYSTFFSTHKPARSCVAVKELPLGCDVEIEVVALAADGESKI